MSNVRYRVLIAVLLLVVAQEGMAQSKISEGGKAVLIRGTYAHPKAFWDKGGRLDDYGVNAIFVHYGSITEDLIARAKAEGCQVYAEFATLNGKGWVEQHPDAHPINEKGERAPAATWFMGACPTNQAFRESRMQALRDLLTKYDIAGVWMDYLHWHAQFEDPYPVFQKTCFNASCLDAFQKATGIAPRGETTEEKAKDILGHHAKAWEDWRCSVIVDWATDIRGIVKSLRPNALLGNYQAPWRDDELGNVRRRCLGLDLDRLAKVVDVFSPMVYHGRCGMPPEWVRDYVEWFSRRVEVQTAPDRFPRLLPIVQAHDEPRIEPEEFEKVLRYGLAGKSTGVMMFTLGSVAQDEGKMAAMKKVYNEVK
ncbi:MAG: hypothetical protein A3F84_12875 [Candidatus Handelsmanbacteria bacterium RIFCSPLOWO2_12_FULL_64_10]|uniref:Glycosyl hydrolase-like 10 domain-containing protein n=1 Tax=Handelsmanbacteria sp. (strain RIFCSPLOWO2_12_FULL_64_10) TaxID=1817868 RepID=A0A1F6C283_HANXR|nr:MAG: hypothetical protein A3F84_12875 [Candidatus Handelsmanbacteria bacterium RIFCSPLOWO2_12_FULL_64_10]